MSFSENLQFLRDRAGMTQEQLAERLEISRQSVSKWESAASYPEMDKLLQLCELFRTDLDTLVRGDARTAWTEDTAGYNSRMDRFSAAVAGGVALILLGVAAVPGLSGLGADETLSAAVLLTAVTAAVVIFIVAGIRYDSFERRNPYIAPFYTREERERFEHCFPVLIAAPVAAILVGVIWVLLFGQRAEAAGERAELLLTALFLLDVALSAGVLVWAGLQEAKYDIEGWNREHDQSPEARARRKKIDLICGVIMLAATVIYLAVGFGAMAASNDYGNDLGWRWGWIGYPIGGVLCSIVKKVIDREA